MKKFYKIRVGDKTEERPDGWNDDYEILGKRVKDVAHTFKEIIKKMKKPPFSLKQEIEAPNNDSLLINVLKHTNSALEYVAEESKTHQVKLDQDVSCILQNLQIKYSEIVSERKKLAQQYGELRTSRDQLNTLYVSLNNGAVNGPGLPGIVDSDPTSTKVRDLQSHIEELDIKCTAAKEAYLTKLHNFAASDRERTDVFVTYLTLQRDYYSSIASKMDASLRDLQNSIAQQQLVSVFTQSLQEHLQCTNRKISYVIETCVEGLLSPHALQQQGLFRISPSKIKGEYFIARLQLMPSVADFMQDVDAHCLSFALKSYLRYLPDTLLGHQVSSAQWQTIEEGDTQEKRIQILQNLVTQLSVESRTNLAYLCHFLHCVTDFSAHNQMDANNLSIVFAPNFFSSPVTSSWQMEIVKLMVQFPSQIFLDPPPDCVKNFEAEMKKSSLASQSTQEESSRDESLTVSSELQSSSNLSSSSTEINNESSHYENSSMMRHRRNASTDLLGGGGNNSSSSQSPQIGVNNHHGANLRPSPSMGPGTARPAPSRPPTGPTTINRPLYKKAPPPPPISVAPLASQAEGATPLETATTPNASESPSVIPTPMPRKNTPNISASSVSEGSPVPRPREGSITGTESTNKPPRPNVPPPLAVKPKLASTSETSKF